MRRITGITLVELLVAMTIIGVLLSLAVPNFRSLLVRRAALAGASTLATDYRLTRAEALKRTSPVTICRSTNSTSCATTADSWHTGWIIFVDPNANQTVDANEEILRVQGALDSVVSLQNSAGAGSTRIANTFRTSGMSISSSETLIVTASASVQDGTRLMCISNQGRASVRQPGVAACS